MINLLNALNCGLTMDKKFPGLYTEGERVQYRYSQNGKYHNPKGAAIVDRRPPESRYQNSDVRLGVPTLPAIQYSFYLNGVDYTDQINQMITDRTLTPTYDEDLDIFFNEVDQFTINLLCCEGTQNES